MPIADILPQKEKLAYVVVTMRLKPESKELLDKLADKHNVSQGQVVDALLLQEKRGK